MNTIDFDIPNTVEITLILVIAIYRVILLFGRIRRHKQSCEVLKSLSTFNIKNIIIDEKGYLEIEYEDIEEKQS
ncbi:MAG: hypothetical protein ABJG41_01495 [Cyclobacteriaceae bacterium]